MVVVWPLVVTSLAWYGVLVDAVARGADACTCAVIAATATCSVAHWCDYRPNGWCARVDRTVARVSFLYFTYIGAARVRHAWGLWVCMCACYARSRRGTAVVDGWARDPGHWVWSHAVFHACVGWGQHLVVTAI